MRITLVSPNKIEMSSDFVDFYIDCVNFERKEKGKLVNRKKRIKSYALNREKRTHTETRNKLTSIEKEDIRNEEKTRE